MLIMLAAMAALHGASAQVATLPSPDAKVLGMGGVSMTAVSGSHALYGNSAMPLFSYMPSQIASSYYGQEAFDYYSVTGFCRLANANLLQLGWRQYLRERDNNDMSIDVGYARALSERWGIGIVGRYLHLKRPGGSADALAADVSLAYQQPLEGIGSLSILRIGGKLSNLGGFLDGYDATLPMEATVGAALDTYFSDAHELTVGADLGYCFTPGAVRGIRLSAGAEYNLMQLFQFRAGYHYGERRDYDPSYWSLGAGVRFLHLRLDFAYLFAARDTLLHNTYAVSFGFDF